MQVLILKVFEIMEYILNFMIRYECKDFGKQFKHENGSFYKYLEISCLADLTWAPTSILHPCECKSFVRNLKTLLRQKIFKGCKLKSYLIYSSQNCVLGRLILITLYFECFCNTYIYCTKKPVTVSSNIMFIQFRG